MELDVLLIGDYDWANTGFRFSRCLRMLGLNALMIKANPHPFMYPEQAIVHPAFSGIEDPRYPKIEEMVAGAKVVHFIGSTAVAGFRKRPGQKVVVQHGGSIYRENHEQINSHFNEYADAAIIQCPDLLGLGAKNEHLIYYPVDTDFIQPDYRRRDEKKLIIGHFPSNPSVKGTKLIEDVIFDLRNSPLGEKFKYVGDSRQVSWIDNLKRMRECDVIIETVNPSLNGKTYGEWGNTALEAAALGKIVITNTHSKKVYEEQYLDDLPFLVANTEEQLKKQLDKILTDLDVNAEQTMTRWWVEKHHSMKATAERIWEKVYKHLEVFNA